MLHDERTVVVCARHNELVSTGPVSIGQPRATELGVDEARKLFTRPHWPDHPQRWPGAACPIIESQSFESSLSAPFEIEAAHRRKAEGAHAAL